MLMLEREAAPMKEMCEIISTHSIGSLLSGGGSAPTPNTPEQWAAMSDTFQKAALQSPSKIPLLYGNDSVHGHSNMVGAVLFPHNIGLGSIGDPAVAYKCAEITAIESRAAGVHWIFAPALSVAQDVRWGRTYEGFSDDFHLVGRMGKAAVEAYQANSTVACAKHWIGDGATTYGTGTGDSKRLDGGDCPLSEGELRQTHMLPYLPCLEAGCQTVMASFSSVQGQKMHGNFRFLTEILKGELNFDGLVVSDWAAVDQLAPKGHFKQALVKAVSAGIDVIMLPGYDESYETYFHLMHEAIGEGLVSIDRINDAVQRILRVKIRMGLKEDPFAHKNDLPLIGCMAHRSIARDFVRRSLVLLRNRDGVLPMRRGTKVLLVGSGAHDLGMQCGGWSINHQGFRGNDETVGTTILQGMQELGENVLYDPEGLHHASERDIAVVVCGEDPYAEADGDACDFSELLSLQDQNLILALKWMRPERPLVLVLLCGRPLPLREDILVAADSLLVAWLPGTEVQVWPTSCVEDVLPLGSCLYGGRIRTRKAISLTAALGSQPGQFRLGARVLVVASGGHIDRSTSRQNGTMNH